MSLGEADAKFPTANRGNGLPPSPSVENPGRVFPKSDPQPAPITPSYSGGPDQCVGNPYLMHGALQEVGRALSEVIQILESERSAEGSSQESSALLNKFRGWRNELDALRGGTRSLMRSDTSRTPEREGGLFID